MIDMQRYWGDRRIEHPYELSSMIIHHMNTQGHVTLVTKEGRSAEDSGLYKLLDELCAFWLWDKSKITIITTAAKEFHPEYNVQVYFVSHASCYTPVPDYTPDWNQEKCYGLFVGRPTAIRAYAIQKHLEFKYRNLGLTTYNQALYQTQDPQEMLDYCMCSGKSYQDLCSLHPYNDLGDLVTPPIIPPHNSVNWEGVYNRIGLEIICETSAHIPPAEASTFVCLTEKFMRPVLYRKPFFLVGGGHTMTWLHELGFKLFDDIVGNYQQADGFKTIDRIFEILQDLIDRGGYVEFIKHCQADVEHNFNLFIEYRQKWRWTEPFWKLYWEPKMKIKYTKNREWETPKTITDLRLDQAK